jgi:hypothetical protein
MLSPKPSKVSLIGSAALLVSLGLSPFWASAQSQGDNASVADAARRAREQKKAAAKPARTLTNDDLQSVLAEPAAPAAARSGAEEAADAGQAKTEGDGAAPLAPSEPGAEAEAAKKKGAKIEAALKQAKAELSEAQAELDVLERKAALDSDVFYSKTGYASDSEGKARLDAQAQQVGEKKRQVDDLKAKLAALEAALGQAADPEKVRSTSPN